MKGPPLATWVKRITDLIKVHAEQWCRCPLVRAYQALRDAAFVVAVTAAAEIGDMNRFQNPKQLMAYLGLIPSERSSGKSIRRGSIPNTGNGYVRRVLVEAAGHITCPQESRQFCKSVSRAYQKVSATYSGKPRSGYAPATTA